jgi:hypothetical protein
MHADFEKEFSRGYTRMRAYKIKSTWTKAETRSANERARFAAQARSLAASVSAFVKIREIRVYPRLKNLTAES